MDFARKQLEKYGWKEGQGLGRNEDGIAKPIKPKLKFDNTGIGHDHGAQFTNRWWETLFNNATQNIDVQVDDESVNLALKSDPIEITNKNYSIKIGDKNSLYGAFLKTSKLTNKGVENFQVSDINEIPTKFSVLSDEELFAACGGRTAHKGARHGLHLSGKLSRIEKQEKMLLKKIKGGSTEDDSKLIKKMKKLHLEKNKIENEDTNDSVEPVSDSSCTSMKKKKKKSKKCVSFNDTIVEYFIPSLENNNCDTPNPAGVEEKDLNNSDEGIEQDIEDGNNQEDNYRNFEEPQFIVSDLSNAEKKKLKKKRKLGKQRATMKFIEIVQDELMEEVPINYNCECKKRKLNIADAKCSERKRSQSDAICPERLKKKHEKKKRNDEKNMSSTKNKCDEQKITNIVKSMDNFCRISDSSN